MIKAYPQGVGAGNFESNIGRFAPDHSNRDAHNTFLRCASELGIGGAVVFMLLIGNALRMLRNIYKDSRPLAQLHRDDVAWASISISAALIILLLSGMTTTLIYMEALWWLLCLPVCLERATATLKHNLSRDDRKLAAVAR